MRGAVGPDPLTQSWRHAAGWKLRTLLHTSRFHCDARLVDEYKARLLGYLEYRTSALYHATDTVLKKLNKVQERL